MFLLPTRLANENTIKLEDEQPYYVSIKDLPKQLESKQELEVIESVGQNSKKAIIILIVVQIVLGIVIKGILSKLWGMIGNF